MPEIEDGVVGAIRAANGGSSRSYVFGPDVSPAIKARDYKGPSSDGDGDGAPLIAHTLRAEGHDASEDGTGRGVPLVPCEPYTFDWQAGGAGNDTSFGGKGRAWIVRKPGLAGTVRRNTVQAVVQELALSVQEDKQNGVTVRDVAGAVRSTAPGSQQGGSLGLTRQGVRRLMPHELERLQGFPDHYTAIPWRGKGPDECPDGPRAKALGNSMAVPVMRWIGRRIEIVDAARNGGES